MIDEVHHYKDWQIIIKNLYDDYRDLKIIYSASFFCKHKYGS